MKTKNIWTHHLDMGYIMRVITIPLIRSPAWSQHFPGTRDIQVGRGLPSQLSFEGFGLVPPTTWPTTGWRPQVLARESTNGWFVFFSNISDLFITQENVSTIHIISTLSLVAALDLRLLKVEESHLAIYVYCSYWIYPWKPPWHCPWHWHPGIVI